LHSTNLQARQAAILVVAVVAEAVAVAVNRTPLFQNARPFRRAFFIDASALNFT
jgi:hypothetical protein